jgi:hypothetical protein
MNLSLKDHLSDAGIAKWISELGCTNAVIPRRNVKVALSFFDAQMPELSIADAVSFLAAMDLSKPVNRVYLTPGERLLGFRTPTESPFKLFFARRGAAKQSLGINPAGRGPVHYVVRAAVMALESFTTGASDTWTPRQPGQPVSVTPRAKKWFGREFGVLAAAGGAQLIVPQSASHLLVEDRAGAGRFR